MTKFTSQLLKFGPISFEYRLRVTTTEPTSASSRRQFAETMNRAAALAEMDLDNDSDDENGC